MTMAIPFLGILFKTMPLVTEKAALEFTVESVTNNFSYFMSSVVINGGSEKALVMVSIMVIVLTFLKTSFRYLAQYMLAPVRHGVVKDIRNALFAKIVSLPLSFFSEEKKGDIISRMAEDVKEIEISVIRSLEMLFREPLTIIVYLSTLLFMSFRLTVFVLILLPVTGYVIGRIGRGLRGTTLRGRRRMGALLSIIEETLSGLRIIKAFNAEEKINKRFRGINSYFTRIMIKMWRRMDLATPLSEFLGTVVMVAMMYYGGSLVLNQESPLPSEAFIAYLLIFSQIINPAKAFTNAFYAVQKGMASVDRIEDVMNADEKIVEKPDAIPIKDFKESIEWTNVSFKYDKEYVLRDINLKIEKGKTVALVGQSGSGKSTMADLIPRFYEIEEGDLLIDGISIKDYRINDLRSLMGNVNQEPILFNDTIFNNIAFGDSKVTEEEVVNAAKVANAHDFIIAAENGYDTNIGDRGSKLSGGERQRISIARAVLKNPPVLILDEATSSLDSESEKLVQDALIKLMSNRTSLVIAHRLSTVKDADEICVLHEGKIVERGKHDELVRLNGVYKKLHDLQMFA